MKTNISQFIFICRFNVRQTLKKNKYFYSLYKEPIRFMNSLKICLISFDNWHYDSYIIEALKRKNIDAYHIKLGAYQHADLRTRILNFLSKVFLGTNPKNIKKQEYILEQLQKHGQHDQILVINPNVIDLAYHKKIKEYTKEYNAYLYDSLHRCPVDELLEAHLFDTIYSFDIEDCVNNGFILMNNYIYFDKPKEFILPKYDVLTVSSFDKRFPIFNRIAFQLKEHNLSFKFLFVSRNIRYKTFKYNLKRILKQKFNMLIEKSIRFQSKKIPLKKLLDLYTETKIIVDIVQGNQSGLSFRVFEAMGLQKKIITNNPNVKNYNFYNPNNILVIDKELQFDTSFFETDYTPIPDAIYNQYTIDSWVNVIFKLK